MTRSGAGIAHVKASSCTASGPASTAPPYSTGEVEGAGDNLPVVRNVLCRPLAGRGLSRRNKRRHPMGPRSARQPPLVGGRDGGLRRVPVTRVNVRHLSGPIHCFTKLVEVPSQAANRRIQMLELYDCGLISCAGRAHIHQHISLRKYSHFAGYRLESAGNGIAKFEDGLIKSPRCRSRHRSSSRRVVRHCCGARRRP